MVLFLNVFWRRSEVFPGDSSWNGIVPFFHLPYSKYNRLKMFLLVSLSKSKFFTRVTLLSFVLHLYRSCFTRVACGALMLHSCRSCRTRVARVWHSRCKLDYNSRHNILALFKNFAWVRITTSKTILDI